MDCLSKETLQDYIDGELSQEQSRTIEKHIQGCEACKTELSEMLSFHSVINQVVSEDDCPSLDTLQDYATSGCEDEKITKHIEFCDRCRSYAWTFQASEDELIKRQQQEELAYQEFKGKELGCDAAKETLIKLLPSRIDVFERGWQSFLKFVLDLKTKAIDNWPVFDGDAQLVGVLGFDDANDPETDAASIILITTLYISQLVADGEIKPDQNSLKTAVKEAAEKLGAGKELQKRLVETVPPLVLKFK